MTLTRSCVLFLGIVGVASLAASLAGHPEKFWLLALVLGSGAAWHVSGVDPLKGLSLAAMALRAALIVLWDMASDSLETFRARYAERWAPAKKEVEEME